MHFLSTAILLTGLIATVLGQNGTKIGYSGKFSTLSGGLQGTVTVINSTTLKISNYELQDASAPALYWWGATNSDLKDGFRISNMHITIPTKNPSEMTIELDAGKTIMDFSVVGLWCEKFGIDFGQTTLAADGSSGATTASVTAASTTSATSSTTSTSAAIRQAVSVSTVLAGLFASALFF
ncbi:uncharacterized protein N7458_006034 [Penicillium daleae]|uniref:DM13 domain-containing protein n=1 Tax=Penicillium daleae TaxID=63821 RepID=A0AAD6C5R8_9EURO|nr:uncharacterized protein N7458_006034 [Penicillium daleae]KAJ5449585.1 hypothetical protein N7458_006034 [Penicillium daleae]